MLRGGEPKSGVKSGDWYRRFIPAASATLSSEGVPAPFEEMAESFPFIPACVDPFSSSSSALNREIHIDRPWRAVLVCTQNVWTSDKSSPATSVALRTLLSTWRRSAVTCSQIHIVREYPAVK